MQHVTIAALSDRFKRRQWVLASVIAVTALYWFAGGLGWRWSMIGICVSACFAVLWPDVELVDGMPTLSAGPAAQGHRISLPLAALDGLPDAALVLDGTGAIVAGNAAASAISPISVGRPLTHWLRSPELLAAAERAQNETGPVRAEIKVFSPVERTLDVSITSLGESALEIAPLMLVVLRDLTEQERVSRMRVDFIANASHELRTPLASVRGFIETLQTTAKGDPAAQARFLAIMQTQAERMSRLIDDLLSLSRIEMREHVLPTATIDVVAVVRDCINASRSTAEALGITIKDSDLAGPLSVTGDRDELFQVIYNLLQNAMKYGRPGGHVALMLGKDHDAVVLDVVDDGMGIAPEHIPRLTERFYRVSTKDSRERGGTGLGLAIVKHIVNRHHGELRITSELGKGSTFTVRLPCHKTVANSR